MTDERAERTIRDWVDLYPGGRSELALAMGRSRMAIWRLEHHVARRVSYPIVVALARALAVDGLQDGSAPPTAEEIVTAWRKGKRGALETIS